MAVSRFIPALLFFTLGITNHSAHGQTFRFIKDPLTYVIDTSIASLPDSYLYGDSFVCDLGEYKISISSSCDVYKIRNDSVIAQSGIDFGYQYYIYNLGYMVHQEQVYFLFFIRENYRDYAALYSFRLRDLQKTKRVHIVNSFYLKSHKLERNQLTLVFDNKTYKVDLKRGLKKESVEKPYLY